MRTRCGAENMPANVHIHILTKVHPRTLLKTLQWQVGLRVSRLSPFPGQLATRSHTIPRGQVVHSSAMHHLILPSATPPLSWVLRLTLAILPCSRHSCSSSLSFTVDANGLGSKRHHGSAEQGKPYPGANPQQSWDSGQGLKLSTPNRHIQHNPLYTCLFTSNHTSLNPYGHINLKGISKTHIRQLMPI